MKQNNEIPGGFKLAGRDDLREYRGEGFFFIHEKTGCQIYHVYNDDEENLFSFNFRTPPRDSCGVAHILEHSVLCGSRKFPVKDPFLSMMKGSVNTFLNAMTYPDKTLYPAASVLEEDYFNLMDVYGDAVFFPLLTEEIFRQEGYRLERDGHGHLRRTGIVYNEMKGNYSTQDGIAADWAVRSLFPDTPYGVDSGGDPDWIPGLTYEDFLAFHRNWYHPSNCRIFLYGNIPSAKILDFLERRFLGEFERREIDSEIPLQPDWDEPRQLVKTWPIAPGESLEGKTTLCLNWKVCSPGEPVQALGMMILSRMLIGNPGSPLYKALLDSGLGEDLSSASGMDFDLNQGAFSVGLRGSEPHKAGAFRELVFATLEDLVRTGFDEDLKESWLCRAEFQAREIRGGAPFGLRLLQKVMKGWNYGGNPGDFLAFAPVMEKLRKQVKEPRFFEELLERWFLKNPHWSLVTVKPDPGEFKRQEEALQREMAALEEELGVAGLAELDVKNERLRAFQEQEDEDCMPSLHVKDIPGKVRILDVFEMAGGLGAGGSDMAARQEIRGGKVLAQRVFCNGILYCDLAFSLKDLEPEALPWLPLFCRMVPGLGLPGMSYERLSRELALKTGGFTLFAEAGKKVGASREQEPEVFLHARLKMLESRIDDALNLTSLLLFDADFDNEERIRQVVLEVWNEMKSSLLPRGNSYVMSRSGSFWASCALAEDRMYGVGQLLFLESLLKLENFPRVISSFMKELGSRLFSRENCTLCLTMDDEVLERQGERLRDFWKAVLPGEREGGKLSFPPLDCGPDIPPAGEAEALAVSSLVSYVGKSLEGSLLGEAGYSHEVLLSQLLKTGPLWEKIRMKGGAYGAFSHPAGMEGIFYFVTYRDPAIAASLDAFRESLEEFEDFKDAGALEKAVISAVGKELKPKSPSQKGIIALKRELYGISNALRQKNRDRLLNADPSHVVCAVKALLARWNEGRVTVMGAPGKLDGAALIWPGLKDNRIILPQ